MKKRKSLNALFENDRFLLLFSIFLSLIVWVSVVVLASPQTTRTIKKVNVTLNETLVSQFGLKIFGETDFQVDVTVSGKKYRVSSANLTADDIVIEAVTTGVNSAGYYNLQLRAADDSDSTFTVKEISPKTIRVYFDTEKTTEFSVEPNIKTKGFSVVEDGYVSGVPTAADPIVSVTGPSGQIDRIEKIVAEIELEKALSNNASEETKLIALDKDGREVTEYITMDVKNTIVNVPVFKVKNAKSIVTFKNIPTNLVSSPLKYQITPSKTAFNILVDEFDTTKECSVGVVDYKMLSPRNNVFKFNVSDTAASNPDFEEFVVTVDMKDYSQEYITVPPKNIKVNNPENYDVKVFGLDKSVVIVGKENDLKQITEDMITVDVDLSLIDVEQGQTITVPAVVNVNNGNCWAYGIYTAKISVK